MKVVLSGFSWTFLLLGVTGASAHEGSMVAAPTSPSMLEEACQADVERLCRRPQQQEEEQQHFPFFLPLRLFADDAPPSPMVRIHMMHWEHEGSVEEPPLVLNPLLLESHLPGADDLGAPMMLRRRLSEEHEAPRLPFACPENACLKKAYSEHQLSRDCALAMQDWHRESRMHHMRMEHVEDDQDHEACLGGMILAFSMLAMFAVAMVLGRRRHRRFLGRRKMVRSILQSVYNKPEIRRLVELELGHSIGERPPMMNGQRCRKRRVKVMVLASVAGFVLFGPIGSLVLLAGTHAWLVAKEKSKGGCCCCCCGASPNMDPSTLSEDQKSCCCCGGSGVPGSAAGCCCCSCACCTAARAKASDCTCCCYGASPQGELTKEQMCCNCCKGTGMCDPSCASCCGNGCDCGPSKTCGAAATDCTCCCCGASPQGDLTKEQMCCNCCKGSGMCDPSCASCCGNGCDCGPSKTCGAAATDCTCCCCGASPQGELTKEQMCCNCCKGSGMCDPSCASCCGNGCDCGPSKKVCGKGQKHMVEAKMAIYEGVPVQVV